MRSSGYMNTKETNAEGGCPPHLRSFQDRRFTLENAPRRFSKHRISNAHHGASAKEIAVLHFLRGYH